MIIISNRNTLITTTINELFKVNAKHPKPRREIFLVG